LQNGGSTPIASQVKFPILISMCIADERGIEMATHRSCQTVPQAPSVSILIDTLPVQ
jgi:hypothetical protein